MRLPGSLLLPSFADKGLQPVGMSSSGMQMGQIPNLAHYRQRLRDFAADMEKHFGGNMMTMQDHLASQPFDEFRAVLNHSDAFQRYLGAGNFAHTLFGEKNVPQTDNALALARAATNFDSPIKAHHVLNNLEKMLRATPLEDKSFKSRFRGALDELASRLASIPGERNRHQARVIVDNYNFRLGEYCNEIRQKLSRSLESVQSHVNGRAMRQRARWLGLQRRQTHAMEKGHATGPARQPTLQDLRAAGWSDSKLHDLMTRFGFLNVSNLDARPEALQAFNDSYQAYFGTLDKHSLRSFLPLIDAIQRERTQHAMEQGESLFHTLKASPSWSDTDLHGLAKAVDECAALQNKVGFHAAMEAFNHDYGNAGIGKMEPATLGQFKFTAAMIHGHLIKQ